MNSNLATALEASTRWCPFSRVGAMGQGMPAFSYNRENSHPVTVPPGSICMAGACMAWRWVEPGAEEAAEFQFTGTPLARGKIRPPDAQEWTEVMRGTGNPPGWPDGSGWVRWVQWRRVIPEVPGRGYCGLSPMPEPEPLEITSSDAQLAPDPLKTYR